MKREYPFISVGRSRKRPMVPVNIINPHTNKQQKFYCLLDTGADGCVFNSDVAKILGHNLKAKDVKNEISFGVSGKGTQTHLHTFIMELLEPFGRDGIVWSSDKLEIGCLENNNVSPILGTDEFLSEFTITFDYANQLATLYC